MIVSSLGSSRMLPAEVEDVVEVFLELVPEIPESAESFLVKCLPAGGKLKVLPASNDEIRELCNARPGNVKALCNTAARRGR